MQKYRLQNNTEEIDEYISCIARFSDRTGKQYGKYHIRALFYTYKVSDKVSLPQFKEKTGMQRGV